MDAGLRDATKGRGVRSRRLGVRGDGTRIPMNSAGARRGRRRTAAFLKCGRGSGRAPATPAPLSAREAQRTRLSEEQVSDLPRVVPRRQWTRRRMPGFNRRILPSRLFFALIPLLAVRPLLAARLRRRPSTSGYRCSPITPRATRELITTEALSCRRLERWNSWPGCRGDVPLARVQRASFLAFGCASGGLRASVTSVKTRNLTTLLGCVLFAVGVASLVGGDLLFRPLSSALHRLHRVEVGRLGPRLALGLRLRPGALSARPLGAGATTTSDCSWERPLLRSYKRPSAPSTSILSRSWGTAAPTLSRPSVHRRDARRVVSLHALSAGGFVGEPALQDALPAASASHSSEWRTRTRCLTLS